MTSVVAVTTDVNQVLQGFRRKPSFCVNTSAATTIYLADSPSLWEGNGVPLLAGFAITWDADTPLWVCTGSDIATMVITPLEGNICNVRDNT